MVSTCSVVGCRERACKGNVTFHRFPAKLALRELWIKALNRKNFVPTKNSRVCENHFTADNYILMSNKKMLKDDAVPSIFDYSISKQKPKIPTSTSLSEPTATSNTETSVTSALKLTSETSTTSTSSSISFNKPILTTIPIPVSLIMPTTTNTPTNKPVVSNIPTLTSKPISIRPANPAPTVPTCILLPASTPLSASNSIPTTSSDVSGYRKVLPKVPGSQLVFSGLGSIAVIPVIPKTTLSSPTIPNGNLIAIACRPSTTSTSVGSTFTTHDLIAGRKARNAYIGDFKSVHLSTITGRSEFIYKVTLLKKKYKQRLKIMQIANKQMKKRKAFLENLLIRINEKQLVPDANDDDLMECFLEEESLDSDQDSESDDESVAIEKMIDDSIAKLNGNGNIKNFSSKPPEEDEFMVFGMSIAALLRLMPENQSDTIQQKIKELIKNRMKKHLVKVSSTVVDAFPGLENIEIIE